MSSSGSFAIYALMANEVACVEPQQSLATAAALMSARKIRHLPVVQDGALVGLLSHRHLLAARGSEVELAGEGSLSELELREPVERAMTRARLGYERIFYAGSPEKAVSSAFKYILIKQR